MPSNATKGAYYKAKTRKWLLAQGWQVADLEVVRWVYRPGGTPIPVKRDQLGADLLALSAYGVVLIQVKGGEQARGGGQFLPAQRIFAAVQAPPSVVKWIVAWAPRAREPRIVVCSSSTTKEQRDGKEESGAAQGHTEADGQSQRQQQIAKRVARARFTIARRLAAQEAAERRAPRDGRQRHPPA